MGIDIDSDLAAGTKDPASVFSEIDALIESQTVPDFSNPNMKNYNALTGSDPLKKDLHGRLKAPVPARLSILDMNTGEYIATSTKFILTSVRREKREKFQVLRGFGEEYMVSAFGKDVPIYSISGVLVNLKPGNTSNDDGHGKDWVRDMDEFYDQYLRISQLVKLKRQVILHYSNRIIRGYIVGKIETDDSNNDSYVKFSMNMVVRKDKMY